ncbi:MAG: SDR family oxidoreductase [Clostridium sp.]|nr:SDR family oxidoreductase [Clostridium sp.]
MSGKLNGKVALVTGSSRGIGRAIAVELAKQGSYVAVNYKTDLEGSLETAKLIKSIYGFTKIYKADVGNFNETKNMIENIINDFGKIDILVNNAGISKIGLFMDTNEEEYDCIMNSNFKSMYNCTKCVLDNMISRKSGNIINISSMWGNVGSSCEVLYSASKGAVNSFTKALGKELAPSNIRVNAIAPGVIDTKMNSELSEDEMKELICEIPYERIGKPLEVGKLAAYLASEDSSYITSQIITIDGGML